MFFKKFPYEIKKVETIDEKGNVVYCKVDDFPSKSFNINPCTGWPSSDITLLMRAQTESERNMLLARVQELSADGSFPPGTPVKDILLSIKPRLIQSPSELQAYSDYITQIQIRDGLIKMESDVKPSENDSPDGESAPAEQAAS